jgi:shikimate dehydrogenase
MHNASITKLGLDAIYLAYDVHPDKLITVLHSMRDMGFKGVNLTVPLKEVAFRGLKVLDESAQMLGAVNTVEFLSNGIIKGHNTDGKGFLTAIREAFNARIKGLSVFVLGSGGAGRAIALTCASKGAKSVAVADIDDTRSTRLAREISRLFPKTKAIPVPATKHAWEKTSRSADIVIQATPSGMKKEDHSLLIPDAFRAGQFVYDLVYMHPETAFMKAARKAGAHAENGLSMLLHQGACAFKIWTDIHPHVGSMQKALEQCVYGKRRNAV